MAGTNRDDFSQKTKTALASRANYRCSYSGCGAATSGPSDESPADFVNIGVAAHIHAAAPGGPRYLATMTSDQRRDIRNAIWLCQTHSRLIDEDPAAFSSENIIQMKADHEESVDKEIKGKAESSTNTDFVAIGSNLVFTGELVGVAGTAWEFRVDHFFIGDLATLIRFSEQFNDTDPYDRFVLANALGDGRQLAAAPAWKRTVSGNVVSLQVHKNFPRISAHKLPLDLAANDKNDLFTTNGNLATVSGLASLPQKIRHCMSAQRGELIFNPTFGVRIKEYFDLYRDHPLLSNLVKLEVIRMACVPYCENINKPAYTPLRCVLSIQSIEQLPTAPHEDWTPFRFHLNVEGVGPWVCDIPIFIPTTSRNNF